MGNFYSIVRQASQSFSAGDYVQAHKLYVLASSLFGEENFKYNLLLCEKLGNIDSFKYKKVLKELSLPDNFSSKTQSFRLDTITTLLLNNSGDLVLDAEARELSFRDYAVLKSSHSLPVEIKKVETIPRDWPSGLQLAPLPESTNDFQWHSDRLSGKKRSGDEIESGISIVVPTFNRSNILDITLACLVNQITTYRYEVIVADDGSREELSNIIRQYEDKLDIKYVRQKDNGYQLCAVRNLGMRCAKYDFIAILDCDMAPNLHWVQSYMELLVKDDRAALIGPRKYIDSEEISSHDILSNPDLIGTIQEIVTNNEVAGVVSGGYSVDWRLEHFRKTDDLRLCDTPFRFFSGGNVAFAKRWLTLAGWFDEDFNHWGGEDNEFAYRLYRAGCFFRAVHGGLAYHQEPPGKENETDRAAGKQQTIKIVEQKVPIFFRKPEPIDRATINKVPLVSIYIAAYNCEKYIERCINSALGQTVTDLEVCVCDDGSTDDTLKILREVYGSNPRVRFATKSNGGIGSASNAAVKMCRGFYIGQLDSDDYLEPDAVEKCLKVFLKDKRLACVYTTYRNVDADGRLLSNGYNWPEYSREKLATAMIIHHFRMFTMRAWNLTPGFDESITNAVDYDMYLKLSEVGPFKHINKICYNRVLHGENTSIQKLDLQKQNHFRVINNFFARQKIDSYFILPVSDDPSCRNYKIQIP